MSAQLSAARLVMLAKLVGSWLKSPKMKIGWLWREWVYSMIEFIAATLVFLAEVTELEVEYP